MDSASRRRFLQASGVALGSRSTSSTLVGATFRDQASTALPLGQVERIMTLCWEIESLRDVGDIARATVPA